MHTPEPDLLWSRSAFVRQHSPAIFDANEFVANRITQLLYCRKLRIGDQLGYQGSVLEELRRSPPVILAPPAAATAGVLTGNCYQRSRLSGGGLASQCHWHM